MKKYKFGACYGFAGCRIEDEFEAEDEAEAEEIAREMALERVDWWFEEVGGDD